MGTGLKEIGSSDSGSKLIKVIGFRPWLFAIVIDGVLLSAATFILVIVIGVLGSMLNLYTNENPIPTNTLMIICGLLLSILYYVLAWSRTGQTVGKSTLGHKVVGRNG